MASTTANLAETSDKTEKELEIERLEQEAADKLEQLKIHEKNVLADPMYPYPTIKG